jgi:homoserine kinase
MGNVKVRVPASSANLGPGFDALGLALDIYNYVSVEESLTASNGVRIIGDGADSLPVDGENIALAAARHLLAFLDLEDRFFNFTLENGIPLSRGLGSSAAARAGALVAVNEWLRQQGMRTATQVELVTLATQLEGHPDNVAAALLGGLVSSAKIESDEEISALAVQLKATSASRGVLPDAVFREDAIFNLSRTALLIAALTTERWDVLSEALRDRLHQDHRAQLMPGFAAIIRASGEAGAYGATLSGAGPTVLSWIPDHNSDIFEEVLQAVETAAAEHEVFGHAIEVRVDQHGTTVI